jgi:hypothetical protein
LPDGLAIFLSLPANLERSQPSAFAWAIRALHLNVIGSVWDSGLFEKLLQLMSQNPSKEHRSEDLSGAQAFKPVFPRICFSRVTTNVYSRIPDNETEASGGCELKM